jgi:CheY-like chemotaxis protein
VSTTTTIAMLAANPAFAAILSRTLEEDGGYRVASFTSVEQLTGFLRATPAAIVVLDTDVPGAPAVDIARGLRQHVKLANPAFSVVAVTRAAPAFHKPLLTAGIDDVLQKPVVPAQLLACMARLAPSPAPARSARRAFSPMPLKLERVGNVIPLFGEGRMPR